MQPSTRLELGNQLILIKPVCELPKGAPKNKIIIHVNLFNYLCFGNNCPVLTNKFCDFTTYDIFVFSQCTNAFPQLYKYI